jgi:anaerobic magnesium-protoporphyrin IX monomethyl ester cyclase
VRKSPVMELALVGAEYEENLALRYLAAVARDAGHVPTIYSFCTEEQIEPLTHTIVEHGYPFVGLSLAFQHYGREFLGLIQSLRRAGYRGHICCGGHMATAAARELLEDFPEIDTIVRHDGELTLVELLSVLDDRTRWPVVEGISCRDASGQPVAAPPRRQLDDLDALPFPLRDRPHAEHAGLNFAPIVGSRGCFSNCNYCCINTWHRTAKGKRYRLRSVANLADEMAYLYHDRDVRIFCFHDEIFFLPRPKDSIRRLRALSAELQQRRIGQIGLVGKCRPDQLDEELLHLAKACGVFRLCLGVENGSEAGLRHLNRLHDLQSCVRALELLRKTGIFACYNILLFEPETVLADLDENIAFLERFTDFPFNFCRAEVYCGSNFERLLTERGRLEGSYLGYSYEIEDPRAELAFRLSSICFRGRNFAAGGVANTNTGLGYEASLLRHFYGSPGEPLAAEIDALVEEINRDTLQHLRRLVDHARVADLADFEGACAFAEELATTINLRDLELGARQLELRERTREFARLHVRSVLDPPASAASAVEGA